MGKAEVMRNVVVLTTQSAPLPDAWLDSEGTDVTGLDGGVWSESLMD